jgi:hypothetical protein
MTPHKQLFRHRPAEGQIGDCWRTTLGCLLDKAPHEVPHLIEDCWDDSARAKEKTRAWLATQGLAYIEYALDCSLETVLASVGGINPGVHYLLGGNSRNGCGHSVIACDDQIVWDPSLDDAGIVGPMEDGYYWVTFLVPSFLCKVNERPCAPSILQPTSSATAG